MLEDVERRGRAKPSARQLEIRLVRFLYQRLASHIPEKEQNRAPRREGGGYRYASEEGTRAKQCLRSCGLLITKRSNQVVSYKTESWRRKNSIIILWRIFSSSPSLIFAIDIRTANFTFKCFTTIRRIGSIRIPVRVSHRGIPWPVNDPVRRKNACQRTLLFCRSLVFRCEVIVGKRFDQV